LKPLAALAFPLALLSPSFALAEMVLADQIDAALAPMFKAGGPGAAVIVVREGKPVFRKAYGLADVKTKAPMLPEMQMRLGSVTKQFTAVAILMLAEQGKLSLQDDITRFLPDYPTKGHRITIEHLLQHKSGIRNYTSMPAFWRGNEEDKSVAQMIEFFKDEPLDFSPGERFAYSNSGYFLLGAIIEKVSGMSYADFIAKHIFEPLEMRDSAYEGKERSAKRRVAGYRDGFLGYKPAREISMTLPYSAGALVSTVDDLARWDAAIADGKLLTADSWKQAFTACTLPKQAACNYGLGWTIGSLQGRSAIAHGGDIDGFNAHVLRLPDNKTFVAVLSNGERDLLNTEIIAVKAAALAIGAPLLERKAIALAPEALDAFAGTYRLADQSTRTLRRKGTGLSYERNGRPAVTLTPYAANAFYFEGSLATIEFRRTTDGKVDGMVLKQLTGDQTGERIAN
jgi:CubicO group peptidase (beta-lactamase class C family)